MAKARYMVFWTLLLLAGWLVQFYVSKWATETEKDPDLTETVLIPEARYAEVAARVTPDRKSTRLNSSHLGRSRMPSSA